MRTLKGSRQFGVTSLAVLVVLLISLPWALADTSPPLEEWSRTFGSSEADGGYSVQETNDGGYIITGHTYSSGAGSGDVYLVKTDSQGLEEWSTTFGGSEFDIGQSVQETSDGGYIITGYTLSFGAGGYDVYLVKTDSLGVEEWSTTFGGSEDDRGQSVQETSDGGYIITGRTYYDGPGFNDVYLVKADSQGLEKWSTTFGSTYNDFGWSVQETSDGGYIITGETASFGAGGYDVYLVKTDSQGVEEWSTTFGGSEWDYGRSVQETNDGGYIITGYTYSFGAGYTDVYLVKTDSQGVEEWSRTFGGSSWDEGWSVQETSDGGYIITGYTRSFGAGESDVYLVKVDFQGVEEWNTTFGGPHVDVGYSVQETRDEGYIIAGVTYSFGAGLADVYLVRVREASITITPDEGPTGTVVKVEGSGWTATETISFTIDGTTVQVVDDDVVTVDSDGTFSAEIVIPDIGSVAEYSLTAAETGGVRGPASDDFDITGIPEIEVSPSFGAPGATVTVTGSNFTQIAGTEVYISLARARVVAETDADGNFEATFTVPAVTFTTYTVTATDEYSIDADDAFKVGLIALIINPISGEAGTRIRITGIGFENGLYNLTFGDELYADYGTVVGEAISDTFYAPNVAPGAYTITLIDTAENELSVQFTVTESTTASIYPAVAPNLYNVSISGNNFADIRDGALTFVIYNSTGDWTMSVRTDPGQVVTVTDSDGIFTGYWIVPSDTVLSLGDYTINITDGQGLMVQLSFSVVAVNAHEIPLYEGWNLIGLSFTPEESSTEVVLSEIIDYVEAVWAFDGTTKTWSSYSPGAPSNLAEMIEDKGYWIKVNTDCILTLYP